MIDQDQIAKENRSKIRIMRWILLLGSVLTIGKFVAWFLTHSNAVLTDALESIINILAAAFGLFSLVYAARPKDENHPYGHGKMEFLAVGFEGGLIFFAGGGMILKAVYNAYHPQHLEHLNTGIWITSLTAIANYFMGKFLIRKGKILQSSTLSADGIHLISDTYSSIVLLAGLLVMQFSGAHWIDTGLTIVLGAYILVVGYRLLRNSLGGLMDEADFVKLAEVIEVLNKERIDRWIDIHNLRVVKYGSSLHIDAHLSLPWYDDLQSTHEQVKNLEKLINNHFGNRVELFIHTDPCIPVSCTVCMLHDCKVRQKEFVRKVEWTSMNLLKNQPHSF